MKSALEEELKVSGEVQLEMQHDLDAANASLRAVANCLSLDQREPRSPIDFFTSTDANDRSVRSILPKSATASMEVRCWIAMSA